MQDRFFGTDRIQAESTGYFRVEQVDGRWWFVTPDGHGFLSLGINHIDSSALKYEDNINVWSLAENLGSVESLITHPVTMTHADVEPEERARVGIIDGLVRASVGLEDTDDLIDALAAALDQV